MFLCDRDSDNPLFFRISIGMFEVLDSEELHEDLDETAQKLHREEITKADLIDWQYYILFPQDEISKSINAPIPVDLDFRDVEDGVVQVGVMYDRRYGLNQAVHQPYKAEPLTFDLYPKGPRPHNEIIREDPELGVAVLERAYESGGDVLNAWDVLVAAIGRADAWSLLQEKLGDEKFNKVRKTIMGEV